MNVKKRELELIRCNKCLMTDTRPGIGFNKDGVCYPCLNLEKNRKVDWSERWMELEGLCRRYSSVEKQISPPARQTARD